MNEASNHGNDSEKRYDNLKVYGRCDPGSSKKLEYIAKKFTPPVDE
jgi:hypothetical protein